MFRKILFEQLHKTEKLKDKSVDELERGILEN